MTTKSMDMAADTPSEPMDKPSTAAPAILSIPVIPAVPAQSTLAVPPALASAPITLTTITAAITPTPPKARQKNLVTLTLIGSDGKPFAGASVKASVAMTSMDMGTTHPAFRDLSDGRYQGTVSFSIPSPWRVTVIVTPPNGAPITKTLDYSVTRQRWELLTGSERLRGYGRLASRNTESLDIYKARGEESDSFQFPALPHRRYRRRFGVRLGKRLCVVGNTGR
jgi:hypothetical protein